MKSTLYYHSLIVPAVLILGIALAGCGGSPDCTVTSLTIGPPAATADHLAASPQNKSVFSGFDNLATLPFGCVPIGVATQAARGDLTWHSSDPVNVTIGNTQGVDYGVATCNNATPGPVTITASGPNAKNMTITGTATMTCK